MNDRKVSARKTNKKQHLHTLAFSKSIWAKCLSDINSRLRLDIMDNQPLGTMLVLALVELAKMSVVGPQMWPPAITKNSVTSRQIIIDTNGRRILDQVPTKIVPGGRYLLILIGDHLECRRATDGLCIWMYNPKATNTSEVHDIVTSDADFEKEGHHRDTYRPMIIPVPRPYG
ncbi:hypothetical protein BDZ94DRAFT_1254815 [Collybia nuda]|uniref:Uncharacterized protein n=1 Tax=Collybia nuda TaxID=64659 RepID=A0A9P6CGM1_9AGAR|nr:hypothetical protein BDZ94DRAFT_1254815 [Collybia nuda]